MVANRPPGTRRRSSQVKPKDDPLAHDDEEATFQIQATRWQVALLRALIKGSLEDFVAEAQLHAEAIHEKFTKKMFRWEIEWESLIWYEFLHCTALYIASSYARPEITGWLLENGADPKVFNHANLKAIDVVGQCRKCKEDEDKVKELLERPLRVFKAPRTPSAVVKIIEEEVLVSQYEKLPTSSSSHKQQARKASAFQPTNNQPQVMRELVKKEIKARMLLDWKSYWLPTEGDVVYEVRYRLFGNRDWRCER